MAKDPAFLFYPGDYLRDTQCLSEKAQVAYDRIMCEHMRNISDDVSNIAITKEKLNFFTKRLSPEEKDELLNVITSIGGKYQIEWVAESICKRKGYSNSRAKNRQGKNKEDVNTYDSHMENENEITNSVLKEVGKEGGGGKEGNLTFDAETDMLANRIQFEAICIKTGHSEQSAKAGLRKYHLWLQENEKYPRTRKAAFAGYEKWLLNEPKKSKNGSNTSATIGKTIEFD